MNLLKEPLVTVVTPVYNGEKYLEECIESVLKQTYKNWEYIIANNCSTDHSAEIVKSYAEKEKRIKLYNKKEFVSALENHHFGFGQMSAESKYCKVVHADDWLFPECIEKMVALAEEHSSVGIVGAYRLEGQKVGLDGLPYPSHVVSGQKVCQSTLLGGPYLFGTPTSLLIRSDIIRNRKPFYDESFFSIAADTAACYEILKSSDFGFVHQVLTFTRRHQEAQTNYAQTVNSYMGANLLIFYKYGPVYLSEDIYKRCLIKEINKYYKFLALSCLQLKDKQFRKYHKNILNKLGYPFIGFKLIKEMCFQLLNIALDPKRVINNIMNRIPTE
jgi:glycosyltransferase involved in cell wall biosynthesis